VTVLSEDFSFAYGGLVGGATTVYKLGAEVGGLGMPAYRDVDGSRNLYPGDTGGYDTLQSRILTLPVVVAADPEDCLLGDDCVARRASSGVSLQELKAVWRPTSVDSPLDLRMPGMPETQLRLYGRPRGLDARFVTGFPHVGTLLTFKALDPYFYGAEVTVEGLSGAVSVTNGGDAQTDRCVVHVTGTGAAPAMVNNSDGGGNVIWQVPLTGVRIVDLKARTVVDGSGGDHFDEVAASSTWFDLQPGANSIALSGGTFSFVFLPAWH